MIISGIIAILAGLASTIYGVMENSSVEKQLTNLWETGTTNPGSPFIVVGVVVIMVGAILLIAGLVRKSKRKV